MEVSGSFLSNTIPPKEAVKILDNSIVYYIHVDIMDGKFVDNKTYTVSEVTKLSELTTKMLIDEVNKHLDSKGILFDGYPRTIAQAEALDAFLPTIGAKVNATVALEADDNILVARLLERGKTSGRIDDQDEEKIRNRYQEYNEKTAPLIGYYKDQNKFHAVDGIGTIAEITERLTAVIDNL